MEKDRLASHECVGSHGSACFTHVENGWQGIFTTGENAYSMTVPQENQDKKLHHIRVSALENNNCGRRNTVILTECYSCLNHRCSWIAPANLHFPRCLNNYELRLIHENKFSFLKGSCKFTDERPILGRPTWLLSLWLFGSQHGAQHGR